MNSRNACTIILAVALGWAVAGSALAEKPAEAPLIPREVLFGNPARTNMQISPDGTRMSYLAPVDNVLNVWVKTVGQDDDKAVTNDSNRGIRMYFWAADNRHIMYLQDVGGNENWRLYGADLESGAIKDLTPYDNVQVQVLGREKQFPDELLINMNKDNPQVHDVYRLNLKSGDMVKVAENPGNVAGWVSDSQLQVRGAIAALPDGSFELWVRDNDQGEWRTLTTVDPDNALTFGPLGFTRDGKSIIAIDARNANAGRLVYIDATTGEVIRVIAEDPQYDVSNAFIHPDTYEVQAVAFAKDREEWKVLDPAIEADFAAIAKLQRGDFQVYDRDDADRTWLVGFTVDNGSGAYYAWDHAARKATFLFHSRPELKKYTLATMEPISFTARDGLTVHGYLTLPPGKKARNLPLVLNVHGGPWHRDSWGYHGEAQWLANRGYACLQINFRGSTGYGKEFVNAGDREWGGKMHDDLVDAVQWAVKKGIADPRKIAIYGGSYGGYAALVGATFTPDLFCCAVDIVGPSNLISFLNSVPPYWSSMLATFHRRIGHPENDAEFLKSRSPLFKVDQIKIPMLIAQGANDPRVKQAESEQIVAAMKERGIYHEYMLFPDEGHGFAKPENRLKFYAAAEQFLAKYLGGRAEVAAQ
ncbi:MAG: S9 family peptidase [Candidatus Zixiibacteriota bacterium]|nr:MAG: S9 family peptidase [candidate division Zixibacteria bacterium]